MAMLRLKLRAWSQDAEPVHGLLEAFVEFDGLLTFFRYRV